MEPLGYFILLLGTATLGHCLTSDDCNEKANCRIVALGKDPAWYSLPSHYGSIQSCIDDAVDGDTCLIEPGRYHEEVKIVNKNNLTLTADPELSERPIMDGTAVFWTSDGWSSGTIGGKKVCTGKLDIVDDRHPYQLFLATGEGQYQMMTNARWPNALWSEKNPTTGAPSVFYNDHWAKSDAKSTRGQMVDKKSVNGLSPLAELGFSVQGAMAVMNVGSWNTFVKPVKSHKANQGSFTYEDDFGNIKFVPSHNQYYLESHEALLDNPGEWYYNKDTQVLKFMPWNDACPNDDINAIRGRVMDYFFDISFTNGLHIENLDFFASNLQGQSSRRKSSNIVLDSLTLNFPSSSKRMLQDYSVPKITRFINSQELAITNCQFVGGEGPALYYSGGESKVTNNLFKWNDWAGQMGLKASGGFATVYSHTTSEKVIGNTFLYNGASAGLRPASTSMLISDNLIRGQCDGRLMMDGSAIQIQTGSQSGSLQTRNWITDSPKCGIRYDSSPGHTGHNGTMLNNLVWRTSGFMVKGDFHNIIGNLGLPNYEGNIGGSIMVRHDFANVLLNQHTKVSDNAFWLADGGPNRGGRYQMMGIKTNNFYGNNSYSRGNHYDGSLVLDGKTLNKGSPNLLQSLVDPDNSDFRPKPGSSLVATGKLIGPYETKYASGTGHYFIPGRQEFLASYPIPHDGSIVNTRDSLMFRSAFRCTGDLDKHLVYITEKGSDFPSDPIAETSANGNVVVFNDHGYSIKSGTAYQWRVDCREAGSAGGLRLGDVWSFSTKP